MRYKAKYFILVATLLGGFQALPALASAGGQASYGEWGCTTVEAFSWGENVYGFHPGSIFIGTYEEAMQQMKDYLVLLGEHHVWPGDIANAAYTCTLQRPYNH